MLLQPQSAPLPTLGVLCRVLGGGRDRAAGRWARTEEVGGAMSAERVWAAHKPKGVGTRFRLLGGCGRQTRPDQDHRHYQRQLAPGDCGSIPPSGRDRRRRRRGPCRGEGLRSIGRAREIFHELVRGVPGLVASCVDAPANLLASMPLTRDRCLKLSDYLSVDAPILEAEVFLPARDVSKSAKSPPRSHAATARRPSASHTGHQGRVQHAGPPPRSGLASGSSIRGCWLPPWGLPLGFPERPGLN
jgi:hypothetical protein